MRSRVASPIQDSLGILLVDDNRHGLVARKTLLEELGYTVTTASNGEEALELFGNGKYDLVITDQKMPRMSGSELITNIREHYPAARIIMLSGFVEGLGLTEENTGADVVISKSAGEVSHLLRAVTRLMSSRISRKPAVRQVRTPRSRSSRA